MLSLMNSMPVNQGVVNSYGSMSGGGGTGIDQTLHGMRVGGPAADQIRLAMQDHARINAAEGLNAYSTAGGQMNYGLGQNALAAQRSYLQSNQQYGNSQIMQLLSPFLSQLFSQR